MADITREHNDIAICLAYGIGLQIDVRDERIAAIASALSDAESRGRAESAAECDRLRGEVARLEAARAKGGG